MLKYGQNILFTLVTKSEYQNGLDVSKTLLLIDSYLALKLTGNDFIIRFLVAFLVLLNITKLTMVS